MRQERMTDQKALLVIVMFLWSALSLYAQTNTGTITGTI